MNVTRMVAVLRYVLVERGNAFCYGVENEGVVVAAE
jgi:hypothetical protein